MARQSIEARSSIRASIFIQELQLTETDRPWPADKVERRPLAELIPAAKNARTHSPHQIEQIAASMQRWGWTVPALIDEDGSIIAGHGRVLAAQSLGYSQAPVMVAQGWSDDEKRAYLLADNQLTLNASWDLEVLGDEWDALAGNGFDMSLLGFDNIDELLRAAAPEDEATGVAGSLAATFGVPPFSVLNAREGWWQARKAAWLSLGIRSELGRGESANDRSESASARINDAAEGKVRYGNPGRARGNVAAAEAYDGARPAKAQTRYGKPKAKRAATAEAYARNDAQDRHANVYAKPRRANAIPGGSKMPRERPGYTPGGKE